jgi:hypothetical protein
MSEQKCCVSPNEFTICQTCGEVPTALHAFQGTASCERHCEGCNPGARERWRHPPVEEVMDVLSSMSADAMMDAIDRRLARKLAANSTQAN